jgi:hypothetical protein
MVKFHYVLLVRIICILLSPSVHVCSCYLNSAISLASKCSASAFRMHIRAHGTLSKVFSALHDAPDHTVW